MKRTHLFHGLGLSAAILLMAGLVCQPGLCLAAMRQGLDRCLTTLIPALFPFFVAGGLLTRLGAAQHLGRGCAGMMRRLYRLPGAAAVPLLLGLLGGYPVGARTARALYQRGELSQDETQRLLAFCDNAGPAFFLGILGTLLGSVQIGAALYGIHLISALLTGLLFRGKGPLPDAGIPQQVPPAEPFSQALPRAAEDALRGLGRVCAMVLLGHVAAALLSACGALAFLGLPLTLLGLSPAGAAAVLTGLTEVTCGVLALGDAALPPVVTAVLCSGLMGFGGLSVHGQALAELQGSGLSMRRHTAGKIVQSLLSCLLTALALPPLLHQSLPVFAYPDPTPWHLLPWETARQMLWGALQLDLIVLGLFLLPVLLFWLKKCWKNHRIRGKIKTAPPPDSSSSRRSAPEAHGPALRL